MLRLFKSNMVLHKKCKKNPTLSFDIVVLAKDEEIAKIVVRTYFKAEISYKFIMPAPPLVASEFKKLLPEIDSALVNIEVTEVHNIQELPSAKWECAIPWGDGNPYDNTCATILGEMLA